MLVLPLKKASVFLMIEEVGVDIPFTFDFRHNFSVYFYMLYLTVDEDDLGISLITFLPQLILLIALAKKFGNLRDLPFCLFCQVNICNIILNIVLHCPQLNRITLGQHKSHNIIRMVRIHEVFVYCFGIIGPVYLIRLIPYNQVFAEFLFVRSQIICDTLGVGGDNKACGSKKSCLRGQNRHFLSNSYHISKPYNEKS